jgi:hypothetical protein
MNRLLLTLTLSMLQPAAGIAADTATDLLGSCAAGSPCYRTDFSELQHIEFGRIPANEITISDGAVTFNVMKSASFLMQGFDKVMPVKQVELSWRSEGGPALHDADQEKQKAGDDAVVKLGLLLRAEKERFNPFLPAWMKQVREGLSYPSEMMIYLVADSRHDAGQRWANPYNERITMVSMLDVPTGDGWNRSTIEFDEPVDVVAIWLMSDGDNTGSSFVTMVREVVLR